MSDNEKKKELVSFLNRKAFDPVLRASPDDYRTKPEKKMLEDIQRSTASEKDRYEKSYKTAGEVRSRYLDDLSSTAAKKKNSELEKLHLPKLPDLKSDFLKLCDRIGVQ